MEVQLLSLTRVNFVDSYKYNIAAYFERKWKGDSGSLSWWPPVKMDEADRKKNNVEVPDENKDA